jgi:hypothetical protein
MTLQSPASGNGVALQSPAGEAARTPVCRPILVTGIPRAGTSWVGKMLEASGQFVYVNEPLSPHHPPGHSPGVLRAPVEHRFQYIGEANEHVYLEPFRDTIALRYQFRAELARNRSVPDLLRMMQRSSSFARGRLRRSVALIDDPFAVFSSAWFARRLGCEVVVVVRHPAAWISSRKQLGWRTDFTDLLAQPSLMADWLEPYRTEMERLVGTTDAVAEGALLWRMVYGVVAELPSQVPEIHVIRHEDLSLGPVTEFSRLYARLGLPFGSETERAIREATSGGGPDRRIAWSFTKSGPSRTAFRPLDSRANVGKWKRALTAPEISRIRALTADVAPAFYPNSDWE